LREIKTQLFPFLRVRNPQFLRMFRAFLRSNET